MRDDGSLSEPTRPPRPTPQGHARFPPSTAARCERDRASSTTEGTISKPRWKWFPIERMQVHFLTTMKVNLHSLVGSGFRSSECRFTFIVVSMNHQASQDGVGVRAGAEPANRDPLDGPTHQAG